MRFVRCGLALVFAALSLGGCDPAWLSCEDVVGMLESEDGLEVVEDEHPTGWGQDRCLTCHSVEAMHQRNCTDLDEVDLAAIQDDVALRGDGSCASCHGANGVEQ